MPKYIVVMPIKGLTGPGETVYPGKIISLDETKAKHSLETGYLSLHASSEPEPAPLPEPAAAAGPEPEPAPARKARK